MSQPALDSATLTEVAGEVASRWVTAHEPARPDPAVAAALGDLVPDYPLFWLGKRMRPGAGDRVHARVVYRAAGISRPQLISASRPELGAHLVTSLVRAVEAAGRGYIGANFPLVLPGLSARDSVVLDVRGAWVEREGPGVARFAVHERELSQVEYSVRPRYPDELRKLGIEGQVMTAYVVRSNGAMDPATFRVVSATHPDFAESVHKAMLGGRFVPAMLECDSVDIVVQQPFNFSLSR